MGYKSTLILSEMVYVKPMHEDCFCLVSESFGIRENRGRRKKRGRQQFLRCCVSGLFTASGRGRNDHLLGKP